MRFRLRHSLPREFILNLKVPIAILSSFMVKFGTAQKNNVWIGIFRLFNIFGHDS